MVAVIQLAITAGATFGGLLYDHGGYAIAFTFGALVLCACAVTALLAARAVPTQ